MKQDQHLTSHLGGHHTIEFDHGWGGDLPMRPLLHCGFGLGLSDWRAAASSNSHSSAAMATRHLLILLCVIANKPPQRLHASIRVTTCRARGWTTCCSRGKALPKPWLLSLLTSQRPRTAANTQKWMARATTELAPLPQRPSSSKLSVIFIFFWLIQLVATIPTQWITLTALGDNIVKMTCPELFEV